MRRSFVRPDILRADVVETSRVDFEGVSLNGLMVRKFIQNSTGNATGANGELLQAITNLASQVTVLTTNASLLRQEISSVQQTVTNIQDFLKTLGPSGPTGPSGPSAGPYDDTALWAETAYLQQEINAIQESLSQLTSGPSDAFVQLVLKPNVMICDEEGNWVTPT